MNYRQVLFYYSVLAATLLFGWILFFLPRPINFIPLLILLPVPLHFWLHLGDGSKKTHADGTAASPETTHKKNRAALLAFIVFITLTISSVSIFAYSVLLERYNLMKNAPKSDTEVKNTQTQLKQITDQLGNLKSTLTGVSRQLDDVSKNQKNQKDLEVLGLSMSEKPDTIATTAGLLKITSQQKVDVYTDSTTTSQILGKAVYNQVYTFNKKIPGWYQIILPSLEQGWIKAQFGKEL